MFNLQISCDILGSFSQKRGVGNDDNNGVTDMQKVQVKVSKKRNDRTSISNIFIDQYMKDANGDFVKVYLYLLRSTNAEDSTITVSEIADLLNLTEKDIIRPLKYWNKVRAIDVVFDEAETAPLSITFLNLENSEAEPVKAPAKAVDKAPAKKAFSTRLNELRNQEEFSDLLFIVENYLGHLLNDTEIRTITYIYDELHFTTDLLEYLLEYCVSNNHANMRYIETVANAWSDEGISTVAAAKEIAQARSQSTAVVAKAFGISGRSVTAQELEFIQRWFKTYHFSTDMVEEACNRTMLNLGKASFTYAEKILKDWHEAGIKTLEAVKEHDAAYKASKTSKVVAPTTTTAATATGNYRTAGKVSANNFNNFSQRTTMYDFETMERNLVGKGNQ